MIRCDLREYVKSYKLKLTIIIIIYYIATFYNNFITILIVMIIKSRILIKNK